MRVGLATGFLATLLSVPLVSSTSADPPKPDKTPQGILKEEDFDSILNLRRTPPLGDFKLQEIEWANKTYPTIRQTLIKLYTAEKEDNTAISEGKLAEKDRRVKSYFPDFVGPGEEAEDMGKGPSLHVVKRFEEKLSDKSTRVHYVNEHWPINEFTGEILLPEVIRVRVQAFKQKEDLYKPGAHNLFITSMPLLIWNRDDGNPVESIYPLIAQQHFYGDIPKGKKLNSTNQTETIVASPSSCTSCHVIASRNMHAKHIFHEAKKNEMKVNYGALTQDWAFESSVENQPGYKKYTKWLPQKVKTGFIKQGDMDALARILKDQRNFENPQMVETLEKTKSIPWLGGDIQATGYDAAREGFTYTAGGTVWEKAIYSYYRPQLTNIGDWWFRRDLKVAPR